MHYTYDSGTEKFAPTAARPSVFIKQELVIGLCEYTEDRMVVSTRDGQILALDGLELVWAHHLQSSVSNECTSAYLTPFLGFDVETFPFVTCSRDDKVYLVNVNEGFVQPLIEREAATCTWYGLRDIYFMNEIFGMSVHFTAKCKADGDDVKLAWCKMSLKPDFFEMLKKHKTIPSQTTEEILQLMQSSKDDQRLIKSQKQKLEETQAAFDLKSQEYDAVK